MCWNLNSFAKENFCRKDLLEVHNSVYDYDIIALCETSLTKELLPDVPEQACQTPKSSIGTSLQGSESALEPGWFSPVELFETFPNRSK